MEPVKLLALDLDGTLLNAQKELTPRTRDALYAAAEAGVEVVPTTGRFFTGMPEVIQKLPFLHYAITINGAQVYDIRENKAVSTAEIPLETALRVLDYLDGFPVIYDCYQDNWGWMTRSMQENAAAFVPIDHALRMVRSLRTPVDELTAYLREQNRGVQKLQLFTPDDALRLGLLKDLAERFPSLSVSTSMPCNIELNDTHANKGEAIASLAAYLGLPMEATMAIGDGLNDRSMIRMAGVGVAMENAVEDCRRAAKRIAPRNTEDGVAQVIEELLAAGQIGGAANG